MAAFDKTSKKVTFAATGFFARVILHEVDHLNGILFIDKAKKITKGEPEYRKMLRQQRKEKKGAV